MKNVSYVFAFAILFATCATTYAQTGPTGTWRVDGVGSPFPWEVVLRMDASGLTGMVSSCPRINSEISEGHMDGNTITFTCKREDTFGKIAFTGKINGDEIAFTWKLQPGDAGALANNRVFGPSVPPRFTAKRVSDGNLAKSADEIARRVRGAEFAAAVNLIQQDMKVVGTLFLPQKVSRVRAVIVVLRWGNGSLFYSDPEVRRLIETTDAALLSTDFVTITTPTNYAPRLDGANGLLMLLRRLAQDTGHQELTDAPLLFWGQSAATSFGSTFAGLYPERTLAFVRYHAGALAALGGDLEIVSKIPALFLIAGSGDGGAQGAEAPSWIAHELWGNGRSVGAPWTLSLDPGADHGDAESLRKANELVVPWITAVIRQRVSPDGKTLRLVTDGFAWMGNNRTGEVAPYGTFPGSKVEASWLPDEASARGWQTVLGKGK